MHELTNHKSPVAVHEMPYLDRPLVFVILQFLLIFVMLHAGFSAKFYEFDDKLVVGPITQNSWTESLWKYSVPAAIVSLRLDYVLFGPAQNSQSS